MLKIIKDIIKKNRTRFDKVCRIAQLPLDYKINNEGVSVLEDIFISREYADYFPFYEEVTIVDVGAHYGYFSIFASKNTARHSKIYAIEPSNNNFQILKKNLLSCNVQNIDPMQLAIGEKEGEVELYEGVSTNHSLLSNYPLLEDNKHKSLVQVMDLESFMNTNGITQIDFLKLDCEGMEYAIVLNATDEVFNRIKVLSMEFHDLKNPAYTGNRLVEKLKKHGFSIVKYQYEKTVMNLNYGKLIAIKE